MTLETRQLYYQDDSAMKDHLHHLDKLARYYRFHGTMSDTALDMYAERCFGRRDYLYGVFDGAILVGIGELRIPFIASPASDHKFRAEVAFTVATEYRGRGIGTRLFQTIKDAAVRYGISILEMIVLPDNKVALTLARKMGAHFVFDGVAMIGEIQTGVDE